MEGMTVYKIISFPYLECWSILHVLQLAIHFLQSNSSSKLLEKAGIVFSFKKSKKVVPCVSKAS